MKFFFQQCINGLQLGSIYALIALGYSMVYGVLGMINIAHGSIFMLGAFVAFLLSIWFSFPLWVILIMVMFSTAIFAMCIEYIAYRPMSNSPRTSAIITALGCSQIIENAILGISPYAHSMPSLILNTTYHSHYFNISITKLNIIILIISFLLMFILNYIVRYTLIGIAIRAISTDAKTAVLLGIEKNKIISLTFAIGGALAGVGGLFYGQAYPVITASMGSIIGWKAFIAAVIGGIGSIHGAIFGGILLGIIETTTVTFFSSSYRDLISYSLLLVILIFKPKGLFTKDS